MRLAAVSFIAFVVGCGSPSAGMTDAAVDGTAIADASDASATDAPVASDASSSDGAIAEGGLAYMIGIKTNGVPTGPAIVEGWLKRPLDIAGTTITTTSYIGSGTPYTTASQAHTLLEVSFPLLSIFGEANALDDLAKAAAGDYDATYTQMAKALASWPNPLLSARIGWEFNGNWYAWSNGVGKNATYASYVSAFKHAAAIIKQYNPHVLIQWCIAWDQPDPTPYWPGAYDANANPGGVDVISMDFYQANITQYYKQSAFAFAKSGGKINLDWMVSFAQAHNVKIALSEYGAGAPTSSKGEGSGAGLDDGAWTADSVAWIEAQPAGTFLWTLWSDDAPADDIVTPNANPKEQAAWSAAWSKTHYAGNWWTGTPPP